MSDAVEQTGGSHGRLPWRAVARVLAAALLAWIVLGREASRPDSWVARADTWLLDAMQGFLPGDGNGPLVLEAGEDPDVRVFGPAPRAGAFPVELVLFRREDSGALFHWPPGPLDLAVVLDWLASSKASGIGVASPGWESQGDGTLAGRVLAASLARLPASMPAAFGVEPGMSAAPRDDAVEVFSRWPVIPMERVRGDASLLPEVNEPGIGGSDRSLAGEAGGLPPAQAFVRLVGVPVPEVPPGRVAVPLLARRGDTVLPSMALWLWLRSIGCGLEEVEIRPGKAIVAGRHAVPVDAAGCLWVPVSHPGRLGRHSALELGEAGQARNAGPPESDTRPLAGEFAGKHVVVAHDVASEGGGISGAEWQAAALAAMLSGETGLPVRVLRRAPVLAGVLAGGLLVAAAMLSLALPARLRIHGIWPPFLLYLAAGLHAAGSAGLFHGMTVPLLVGCAAFLAAASGRGKSRAPGDPPAGS